MAAVVLAGGTFVGAAYLAGSAIVDGMRQVGTDAAASSLAPSAAPRTTPAQAASTPGPTGTASPGLTPTTTPKPTPARTSLVHVVVKGETLIAIAARYGVTVAAIKEANAITDVSLIYVGEQLVIPSQ